MRFMKKNMLLCAALALLLCSGCGSSTDSGSVDAESSATAKMLTLDADVTVRAGTAPDGDLLLDTTTMEGFFASDHYSDQNPYGFALVLTGEGKKQFRNATRELAKDQSAVTLWAGEEAICSPVITGVLNTKYVIFNIGSVKDAESYQYVVDALSSE